MPRKKKAESVDPIPLTCGACRFCSDKGGQVSPTCFGLPPQPMWDDDESLISVRPIVRLEDTGCSLFQPRFNS